MTIVISREKLEDLAGHYGNRANGLRWPVVAVLPGWLNAWWQSFGSGFEPMILAAHEDGRLVGLATLKVQDGVASFIGDNSVCDYLDFITAQGKEDAFGGALLDYLPSQNIRSLVMETLRPQSVAGHNIAEEWKRRGKSSLCTQIDVSAEMELPTTWEDYLASLESKQRREAERKMRQLESLAEVRLRVLRDSEIRKDELSLFFQMMVDSRRDKAVFLTEEMRLFFERVAAAMSTYGMLRLAFLEVGVARVAGILYFEDDARIYLYNSGYVPQYANMDAGLVSKLYCIRQAISEHKRVFDFMKGPEVYKSRLGGREVGLSRCVIDFT
jgi:CelD/BcsL family acetyltransferase involved in cellulose biosynthesis